MQVEEKWFSNHAYRRRMASARKNYSVALFFVSGLVAGFIVSVMFTGQFGHDSMVRNTYRRWQNRHILGHQEVTDFPTTTWPTTGGTTQRPRSNVSPADGETPGGGAGEGGPPMSHDEVEAQDMKSNNDIRVFDEHKHHDDTTVADKLFQDVKVFCWIMTSHANHKSKAVHVKATWARRCNKYVFMSDRDDAQLPAISLTALEGREHLTAKTMHAFDYTYKQHLNEFDWFIKADDDTYLIVENLRYMLSAHSPQEPVYFGHHFKTIVRQGYFSGGGGYAVSKEALRRFGGRKRGECAYDHGAEDVEFGRCMEKLGVKTGDSRDALGRSRFHCFNPETHLHGGYPDWYYQYDKYGAKKGQESISDYPITFHYVSTDQMYDLEYYIYHLRAYGIFVRDVNLNAPAQSDTATRGTRQISPSTTHPPPNTKQQTTQASNFQQPNIQQSNVQQPYFQQPIVQQPNFQPPNVQQNNVQQPNFQQPNVQQPNFQPPNVQQNNVQQPDFEQPNVQQHNFQQPNIQQSNFQQPNIQQPNVQPNFQQPSTQQPNFQQHNVQEYNVQQQPNVINMNRNVLT